MLEETSPDVAAHQTSPADCAALVAAADRIGAGTLTSWRPEAVDRPAASPGPEVVDQVSLDPAGRDSAGAHSVALDAVTLGATALDSAAVAPAALDSAALDSAAVAPAALDSTALAAAALAPAALASTALDAAADRAALDSAAVCAAVSAVADPAVGRVPARGPGAADADRVGPTPAPDLRGALRRGVAHLLARQDEAGWWKYDLESNTTIDAEDLFLREYLGIRTAEETAATARFIRSRQCAEGSWPQYFRGPGNLSTTVESYIALRLAGDDPQAEHMATAAAWIRERGGIPATRVFTRIWLALFGWWRWEDLPVLPPEMLLLPRRAPLNIYSFASWARQTIVPLTVVSAFRPVRPTPFALTELLPAAAAPAAGRSDPAPTSTPTVPSAATPPSGPNSGSAVPAIIRSAARSVARVGARGRRHVGLIGWKGVFEGLDTALHLYHRHPVRPLRRWALTTAERWIIARQEADGCFGGIQPPTVYSIIALLQLGYELDHPVLVAALRSLESYTVHREDGSRLVEASQSPIWDTALAVNALADAGVAGGVAPDHPALVRAADWLLGQEIAHHRGDWAVANPRVPAGGWAFEFENDTYPDTDDTAEVLLALRRVRHPDPRRVEAATQRATAWMFGLQSSDGGWGAYDADNTSRLPYQIPFADFGALTDPPSADVTAHIVELLADIGLADDPRTRRGVDWLLRHQEADGSWFGRWGVNYLYGTGAVLPALRAVGLPACDPALTRAADWLVERQNADGGWGEEARSYEEEGWAGRGESTPSQTAWAMLGLLAADRSGPALDRGARWLAEHQRPDGTWDEDAYTGTGFPGFFYINYGSYRLVWPVMALGRYLARYQSR